MFLCCVLLKLHNVRLIIRTVVVFVFCFFVVVFLYKFYVFKPYIFLNIVSELDFVHGVVAACTFSIRLCLVVVAVIIIVQKTKYEMSKKAKREHILNSMHWRPSICFAKWNYFEWLKCDEWNERNKFNSWRKKRKKRIQEEENKF